MPMQLSIAKYFKVTHVFVNRLGSHLIGISTNTHGAEEVILWNMESDGHRHMVQSPKKMFRGESFPGFRLGRLAADSD